MKRIHKIIVLVIILFICIIGVSKFNNKNLVKSVRSEHQLLEFYNSYGDSSLNTFERILTLPFGLSYDDYIYSYDYRAKIIYDEIDVEYDATTSDGKSIAVPNSSKDYSKTNIQVEGVDEADIIKADGDYIYSISRNNIIITNVKDPNNVIIESKIYTDSSIPSDLLLYKNYLVVFSSKNANGRYNQDTLVEVYDVSDKNSVKRVKSFELYEPYYTSRCIDGNLYVFSEGYLRKENNKIVREYKEDNKTKEINLKDIKYLKDNSKNVQTLIAHLDLNNTNDFDVKSYLIDISNAYVSKNNIYLLSNTYENHKSIKSIFTFKGIIGFLKSLNYYNYDKKTKIYKFEINKSNGVVFDNTKVVEGTIVNQYSLDEKDNNLRIALETDDGTKITILDENLKLIGETEKVAKGEKMYASRFMGDKAYLVTYINTDPLFVVDLSDSTNPKILGELKIPGYSTYLHPYDENHLIGIGMDTEEVINRDSYGRVVSTWVRTNGMKMCLFDVTDVNNPKEISKTTIGDSRTVSAILSNPKALLFSKEKKLLAIPVNNYDEDFSVIYSDDYSTQISNYNTFKKSHVSEGYFVYNLDLSNGFELKGIINHEKNVNNNHYNYYGRSKLLRGVYIDDNLYTVSEDHIKVNYLEDLTEISSLDIK